MKPPRLSLHLGVNSPDPTHYGDRVRPLTSAHADATAWFRFAQECGFDASHKVGPEATTEAVIDWLRTRASTPGPQQVLITWAGHGTQVPGARTDHESDGLDETWVMWDRMLLDDEIAHLLAGFSAEATVVVIVDSCHSQGAFRFEADEVIRLRALGIGTRARRLTTARAAGVYDDHRSSYEAIRRASSAFPRVSPRVLGLAACEEDQLAYESDEHGDFTATLLRLVRDGFVGTYRDLAARARAELTRQTPRAYWYNGSCPVLDEPAFVHL